MEQKGVSLSNLGKDREALQCYDKAIELDPNYATAWGNKGLTLSGLGRHTEALPCFDKAIDWIQIMQLHGNKGLTPLDWGGTQRHAMF